jgi:hypothetical protein
LLYLGGSDGYYEWRDQYRVYTGQLEANKALVRFGNFAALGPEVRFTITAALFSFWRRTRRQRSMNA